MKKNIQGVSIDYSGLTVGVTVTKLKGKAKTYAENAALSDLIHDGIAPLHYPVSSPVLEKSRTRTLDSLDARRVSLQRAKEILVGLPMGVMLYVRALSRVYEAPEGHSWGTMEINLIVTPISINLDSIRCILWSQEYTSWYTDQMVRGHQISSCLIKLVDLRSFRPWVPDDAALTVNHRYQSPAYKRLAYSV
jgi:hypothetical protein